MEYNMKTTPRFLELGRLDIPKSCPRCDHPPEPFIESQCVLNKPLMMVIPSQGVHLSCPVHPAGHHIFGPQVTC